MALTNRVLCSGDFRPEKSPDAALTSSSPGSKAAPLYHYFRVAVSTSIAQDSSRKRPAQPPKGKLGKRMTARFQEFE